MTSQKNNWMHEPLAVVGMSCRLPGGDNLQEFWHLLESGRYGIDRLPDSFFDRELYYHPEKGVRGRTYSDVGGLIRQRDLDWSVMPITRAEAESWDPCHLILCEVASNAFAHAGYDFRNLPHRRTGVYIGHSGGSTMGGELAYRTLLTDYVDLLEDLPSWQSLNAHSRDHVRQCVLNDVRDSRKPRRSDGRPLVDAGYAAGLISRAFGLTGPHMVIDAACASSLVALALSAAALHSDQIDMAIVGGASFNKSDSLILFSQAQSCSASASRPFDAGADGLISSEGYVVFVLKTLRKALANNDRVHAVIRGIGVSSDGRGRSLWAPRKEGQQTAIERAYFDDVTPDTIQMVEAHATSTQVGDATEMEALATFFKQHVPANHRVPVGSVKSNIGHTLETAGLAGLVKAILSIQHGIIPPSINVSELNRSIPWDNIPLFVPHHKMPWPEMAPGAPRRAAVNAFGIGGLNVHVVVEQFEPSKHRLSGTSVSSQAHTASLGQVRLNQPAMRDQSLVREPSSGLDAVAVVGRGLVLPGALNLQAFADLLVGGKTHLVPPPANRWRNPKWTDRSSNNLASCGLDPAKLNNVLGGYISEFAYDWRRHKVPPKQISQANPVQFMLLDAAEQALSDAGYLDGNKKWNRQRAAVVVGSVFGGDFGNALYAGLRLPEFQRALVSRLKEAGLSDFQAQQLADQYNDAFLKANPALLDETGSFTSSTLASRLSKTFDLMGGAMAIDAGEVSGLAAIDAAMNLLRSGTVDYVLCATGQYAMDRASLERVALHQKLASRDQAEQFLQFDVNDPRRSQLAHAIPSEGVALLMLRRLDDALADGDQVFATIHDVAAGLDAHNPDRSLQLAFQQLRVSKSQRSNYSAATPPASLVSKAMCAVGNLQAAQGIVDVIETSIDSSSSPGNTRAAGIHCIAQQTLSGLSYVAAIERGVPQLPTDNKNFPGVSSAQTNSGAEVSERAHGSIESPLIVRLAAQDIPSLRAQVEQLGSQSWSQLSSSHRNSHFDNFAHRAGFPVRAAMVIHQADYQTKIKTFASQIGNRNALVPLAEQGLFWSEPADRTHKVVWLFPGQGSQSPGMLKELIAQDPVARQAMDEADNAMLQLGRERFAELAWNTDTQLGADVWQTQASMLIADYVMMKTLLARGVPGDVVTGHSFGEFAAMLAAGCWDIGTALQATLHRCNAITRHAPHGCGMLSIQAPAPVVQGLIQSSRIPVHVSHRNAPEQTVVGGSQAAVTQFAQVLDNEGLVSRILPVPTAFHTPMLASAQPAFADALQSIAIAGPSKPLLSGVSVEYESSPEKLRKNLTAQLAAPLDFVLLMERLVADQVGLAIEVGPQQVLARLVRQIAPQKLVTVATDHPKRGALVQLLCAQACAEVYYQPSTTEATRNPQTTRNNLKPEVSSTSILSTRASSPVQNNQIVAPLHFDATQRRRERLRSTSARNHSSGASQTDSLQATEPQVALHYDASQIRRDRNRQQTQHSASGTSVASVAAVHPTSPVMPQSVVAAPVTAPVASIAPVLSAANESSAPIVAVASGGTSAQRASTVDSSRIIASFLIDFVVEQTGYPAEIIELDWDIEADLGIDSIKKAQLFGELREFFDLESLTNFSLDKFRTLRDIVNLLVTTPGKGDWLERRMDAEESLLSQSATQPSKPIANSTAAPQAVIPPSVPPSVPTLVPMNIDARAFGAEPALPASTVYPSIPDPVSVPSASPLVSTDQPAQSSAVSQPAAANGNQVRRTTKELEQFLVDFVVEQTGYPPEIVELDADLEADLGIDSIKKAQLFGELREMFVFPVAANPNDRLSLNDYRTLRSVLDLLVVCNGQETNSDASATSAPVVVSTSPEVQSPHFETLKAVSIDSLNKRVQAAESLPHATADSLGEEFNARSEFPTALVDNGNVGVCDEYRRAVLANMQALAGRPHRLEDAHLIQANGSQTKRQRCATALARATGIADLSLLALDNAVLAQAKWQMTANNDQAEEASSHGSEYYKLLDYQVPEWLTQGGGVPLGIQIRRSNQNHSWIELLTPGCVTASAILTSDGVLLATGKRGANESSSHEPHPVFKLNEWLQTASSLEWSEIEQWVRKFRSPGDWWLAAYHLPSRKRMVIESCDGAIVVEKGQLSRSTLDGGRAVGGNGLAEGCHASLGYDADSGELRLISQQRLYPHAAIEQRIPAKGAGEFFFQQPQIDERSTAVARIEPVRYVTESNHNTESQTKSQLTAEDLASAEAMLTRRFILRLVPSPLRPVSGRRPAWSGTALVIGDNPVATQLEARLRGAQVPVVRWSGTEDPTELAKRFDELASKQAIRHLFLTTPCDADAASTLDLAHWQRRRNQGLMSLFWLCQRWHQNVCASGWLDDVSLVAVTSLGGDFGISGQVHSIEGGGLAGLLKSLLIESWVQGFRTFPIKVLDTRGNDSPAQIVEHVWQELANPNFDMEVAYPNGTRHVVRAIARPIARLASTPSSRITRGGTWVCTGGARGITAFVAEHMALRYGLKLHLLGTAPVPSIPESWKDLDEAGTRALKAEVMTSARNRGLNPVTTWQDTEKALEIERNLRRFASLGIEAHYHHCNVSDRQSVQSVLDRVRRISGPIRGVLHGAGVGKDARFDRKQPEKVQQCIQAKIDGAWSLFEATWNDPLEAFVGFGSISGRFGANGHTDYSLANDMLCKQMDWLRRERPEVHAIGFHWHAWGDIGMATKPETRLALEMINMQFMPAQEGLKHLLQELESAERESEVLITDDRYHRLFYSPDAIHDFPGRSVKDLAPATPLLNEVNLPSDSASSRTHIATLDPVKDPFLSDHRLDDRPLLPIVIGTELLLEAARAHLGSHQPLCLRNVQAVKGMRLYTDQKHDAKLKSTLRGDGVVDCQVMSDFLTRDGKLVERDRVHFTGSVSECSVTQADAMVRVLLDSHTTWQRPMYPPAGSKFYVGLPLQRLRGFAFGRDGLVGRITAPALIELAGGGRLVNGWQIPSSALDACLFATGILAWQTIAPGSALPTGFGEIKLGRQPLPGEACEVHIKVREHSFNSGAATSSLSSQSAPGHASFDFTLYGVDQDVLVNVRDYRVAWLVDPTQPLNANRMHASI